MCNCSSTGFNPFNMPWMFGQPGNYQQGGYSSPSIFPGQSQGQCDPFMMMMMMMMNGESQPCENNKKMDVGTALNVILKGDNFETLDKVADNGKTNGVFVAGSLDAIIKNPGDHPPELVEAAKVLKANPELLKELDTSHHPDADPDKRISKGDIEAFKEKHPYVFEESDNNCNNNNAGWDMPPFMQFFMQMFGWGN